MPNSDLFADLQWRGLVHQTTADDSIASWLAESARTLYAGSDPSADSLHVGSLLPLVTLRRFQKAGHRPIALVGGATGMIGDPSGKSEERNLLDVDQLRRNVQGIEQQMRRFLDFDGDQAAILVNNFDWMRKFSYLDFLRDIGKNFPVNVMLAKDSVKSRIGRDDVGISYTEFSYMLLQAYDFVHLHTEYGCELQIGGSDQWGNITAGIDLARRMHSVSLVGMTMPLLLTSDGRKMGKTEKGTVWLSAERTSPYDFYQYWINVADDEAGNCLRMLTELPREEIEQLDAARESNPQDRLSQQRLAEELTRMVHGEAELAQVQRSTAKAFTTGSVAEQSEAEILELMQSLPTQEMPRDKLDGDGLLITEAMTATGLCKSNGEVRRKINEGGVYVNDAKWPAFDQPITADHLLHDKFVALRLGKKKRAIIRFS